MTNRIVSTILQTVVTVSFPFFLLVMSVMIVFQPWFLSYEYSRSQFPEDRFGFTRTDREKYGISSLRYVTDFNPAYSLDSIQTDQDQPLYNDREIVHMKDVRGVFQAVRLCWIGLLLFYGLILALSWRRPRCFAGMLRGISLGSFLSVLLMILAIVATLLMFDPLFAAFHSLFFSAGSWLFYESDSLIRLFPLKLWIDGFIAVGFLTFAFSMVFLYLSRKSEQKVSF